jgi:hypothetical protein
MRWPEIRQIHLDAAAELVASAERIPAERWTLPRAEGKWSPAEIVEHLTLAYDIILRELGGGPGMMVRTKLWQRIMLRFTLIPKLLRGEGFPAGARAPRETRPQSANPDQKSAVAGFRDRAARLDAEVAAAIATGRRIRLTHAYFGTAGLGEAMLLCARHVQHHQKQL